MMPQITIFYTRVVPFSQSQFEQLVQQLPLDHQAKIKRYIRPYDAYTSLLGRLLLRKQFQKTTFSWSDIRYNTHKRPYLTQNFDFNISHSADYVICAACQRGIIGIDLEKICPVELKHFTTQWTTDELNMIHHQTDLFHYFWTRKEAIVKANGKGLSLPLHEFSVISDVLELEGQTWFLYPISCPQGYIAHLAYNQSIDLSEIKIQELSLEELTDEKQIPIKVREKRY